MKKSFIEWFNVGQRKLTETKCVKDEDDLKFLDAALLDFINCLIESTSQIEVTLRVSSNGDRLVQVENEIEKRSIFKVLLNPGTELFPFCVTTEYGSEWRIDDGNDLDSCFKHILSNLNVAEILYKLDHEHL